MPRTALTLLLLAGISLAAAERGESVLNPHLSPATNLAGCPACHRGHGVSRSPMLAGPVRATCLRCHGTQGDLAVLVTARVVAPGAKPPLLGGVLQLPFQHPLSPDAISAEEPAAITCTSCHSSHRSMPPGQTGGLPGGGRKLSQKDPRRFEYELCEGCHGDQGSMTKKRTDVSRLFSATNRSYHPVEDPATSRSPSVAPGLSGKVINCTDCHGNDDPTGPAGVHGSRVRSILRFSYSATDGLPESEQAYALCYSCHDRTKVLARVSFPGHAGHITAIKASCATCHSAHGSIGNRALIRFGEETRLAGVTASPKAGKLAFVSEAPGSGSCYLMCHGKDHAPESYGAARAIRRLSRKRPLYVAAPLLVPE